MCLAIPVSCTPKEAQQGETEQKDEKNSEVNKPQDGNTLEESTYSDVDNEPFNVFIQEMAMAELEYSPLTATFTFGDLKEEGLFDLASELDHLDLGDHEVMIAGKKDELEELEAFEWGSLSRSQQTDYKLAKFNLENEIRLGEYEYIDNLIQPTSGIQVEFPLALMQIELETKDEIDAFIERIRKLPRLFDEVIAYEQERYEKGYGLPGYLYTEAAEQIDAMLVDPESFMMYLSFVDRIDAFEGLSEDEKKEYKKTYLALVKTDLYPAFEAIKEQSLRMSDSKAGGSISEWKDGKAYYEDLVAYKTSGEMDVEALEEWASAELSKAITGFQTAIEEYPDLEYMDYNAVLPIYNSIDDVYDMVERIYQAEFLDYGVSLASENIIPKYLEEHLAAGFYFPVTIDGEDYGNMFLRQDEYNNVTADTAILYYHENIPGHHLYYSYIANSDASLYRKMNEYLPYEEGWANYVQNQAFNYMGLPEGAAKFYKLNSAFANAFMVLIDIKFHYEGLSIDEVTKELMDIGYDEETVTSVVNRMICKPGEMIHYMYGEYKMNAFKREYEEKMGDAFDIKSFHEFILNHYGLPFFVVEEDINNL